MWLPMMVATLVVTTGCSQQGTAGGTRGRLTSDGVPLPQMQVTVFDAHSNSIATGFTQNNGQFELVSLDGAEPVLLSPGEYRWTLQTVGAEVDIPKRLTDPASSDLAVEWNEDNEIVLEAPGLKTLRVSR
ncbi:MAG: carboxypeptidase regulatory-like domain-containing protein [Planctomycetales bacterium]|nr:carboxypeptidase regulatory-like domain-containing protein [Planctomycetales bacterium]